MKKYFKWILLITIISVCLYTSLSLSASAETIYHTEGVFSYSVTDEQATVIICDPTKVTGDIILPSTLGGYPVVGIDYRAFYQCTQMTSISIPDGVTYIGEDAFEGCTSLVSVNIPDSVHWITYDAFYNCTSLEKVYITDLRAWCNISFDNTYSNPMINECDLYIDGVLAENITIPDGITHVGFAAFKGCKSLKTVEIPYGVTNINLYAFSNCKNLESATIPYSVLRIEAYAFSSCSSLKSIDIPPSVTHLGDTSTFYGCTALESVSLPSGITRINENLFRGCTNLKRIDILDGVTTIAPYVFLGCTSLTDVTLPVTMKKIEKNSFGNCYALTNVYYLGAEAQWSSVSIDEGNECLSSANIYCKDIMNFGSCNENIKWKLNDQGVLTISGEGAIPDYGNDSSSSAPWRKVNLNDIKTVVIEEGITSIGKYAFFGCGKITEVSLPDSLKEIKLYAFGSCYGLEQITLPDFLTTIGQASFDTCPLTEIYIPENVTDIAYMPFPNCDKLKEINVSEDNNSYSSVNGVLFDKDKTTLILYPIGKEDKAYTIPDGVNAVYANAFYGNNYLTSVIMPDSVTRVRESAFQGCNNLESITLSNNLKGINRDAFAYCTKLNNITIPKSLDYIDIGVFTGCTSLSGIILPEGLTDIGWMAFENCTSLSYAYIPASVESISNEAFYGCTALKDIYYSGSLSEWSKLNADVDATVYSYTTVIVYQGDYSAVTPVEIGDDAVLPVPPENYGYIYTVDGAKWDGRNITESVTVDVALVDAITVTFTGAFTETQIVNYGENATLSTPPEGHYYTYTVNGEEWNNEPVTEPIEIVVTDNRYQFTVTFTGDYNGTQQVYYGDKAVMPTPPDGYVYSFSAGGSNVKQDITIKVDMQCDITDVFVENLELMTVDGKNISGEYYGRTFSYTNIKPLLNSKLREIKDANGNSIRDLTLERGVNIFEFILVSETGNEETYTLTINRNIPDSLGALIFRESVDRAATFYFEDGLKGNPVVKILFDDNQQTYRYEKTGVYNSESKTVHITDLPQGMGFFFKAVAIYDEISVESKSVWATIGKYDCYILSVNNPPGGTIVHGENGNIGTISDLRFEYDTGDSIKIDVTVSEGATWDLYYGAAATLKYADKTLTNIKPGNSKTAYIKVVSSAGETYHRIYSITVYRQSKSSIPSISSENGVVTITADTDSVIKYTTDGSLPSENNGIVYTGPFTVPYGTIVRAVAKETDKDESSDIVSYVVTKSDFAHITELSWYTENDLLYEFEFYVESFTSGNGYFITALYNDKGLLVGSSVNKISSDITELVVTGTVTATETPASYKAFIWRDLTNYEPVSDIAGKNF